MNVLISAAGRRVGLIGCFRESFRRLGIQGRIVAADASLQAPALHFADHSCHTPRCDDPAFLPRMIELAERERIDLIVPTIDTELPLYARARPLFEARGTAVAISAQETIAICADKQQTHRWLLERGVPVPSQQNLAEAAAAWRAVASHSAASHSAVAQTTATQATVTHAVAGQTTANGNGWSSEASFPLIVKPRRGSGSAGVRRIASFEELQAVASTAGDEGRLGDYVVEEIAPGQEYTINVFVDVQGTCRAAVPHRRVEVRGGEVSKATTVRHAGLIELAWTIAEALPGARGPLSIQCFLAADGSVRVTEINARFGGGYPLTHRAGARFTDGLLVELLGAPCTTTDDWTDSLTMLRYDREVFLSEESHALLIDERHGRKALVVA